MQLLGDPFHSSQLRKATVGELVLGHRAGTVMPRRRSTLIERHRINRFRRSSSAARDEARVSRPGPRPGGQWLTSLPTQTASITFTVTEVSIGEWEFGCFEEDGAHWDDGMKGTLIVEEG